MYTSDLCCIIMLLVRSIKAAAAPHFASKDIHSTPARAERSQAEFREPKNCHWTPASLFCAQHCWREELSINVVSQQAFVLWVLINNIFWVSDHVLCTISKSPFLQINAEYWIFVFMTKFSLNGNSFTIDQACPCLLSFCWFLLRWRVVSVWCEMSQFLEFTGYSDLTHLLSKYWKFDC